MRRWPNNRLRGAGMNPSRSSPQPLATVFADPCHSEAVRRVILHFQPVA